MFSRKRDRTMRAGFPVMPGHLPVVGHFHRLLRHALPAMSDAVQECGPIFWVDYGAWFNFLAVIHEDGLSLLRHSATDSSHLRKIADSPFAFGESIMALDGAPHRRLRSVMAPTFTPSAIKRADFATSIASVMQSHAEQWLGLNELPVLTETRGIALEIIFRVLGIPAHDLQTWRRWYEDFVIGLIPIPIDLPGSPLWRSRRARVWLMRRTHGLIRNARTLNDQQSLLGSLVHGVDEHGQHLSDQQLVDNMLLFIGAGHETTASVMAWMLLHLAQDPTRWRRLCDEANGLDGSLESDTDVLAKVPFAEALFRESLRLYPPSPIAARRVHTEFELLGHQIPVGVNVASSLMHLSRLPEHYPDPDRWLPERWLEGKRTVPNALELCQFGNGPHFCLGYYLALLEATIFIVRAARTLSKHGLMPRLIGAMPAPIYVPFTRPPYGAHLRFEPSRTARTNTPKQRMHEPSATNGGNRNASL